MIAELAADLIRFGEARESNVVERSQSKKGIKAINQSDRSDSAQ